MYWNEVIELGAEVEKVENFETVREYIYTKYFANELSVRQSEFYQANINGLKPELAFEVRAEEYEGQQVIKWKNKLYYLVRTYRNQKNATVELYVTSDINAKNEYISSV